MSQKSLNGRLGNIVDELVRRGLTLEQARQEFERQFILASLRLNGGSIGRSAKCLGVHRNTLRNKVTHLGIESTDYQSSAPSLNSSSAARS